MNCSRCHRTLKNASASGYGPRCAVIAFGSKPRPVKREPRTADALTPDLFADEFRERDYMGRVSELIGSISLEMS